MKHIIPHTGFYLHRAFAMLLCYVFIGPFTTQAQVPYRAPKQDTAIVLTGGTAHIGNGWVLQHSAIRFEHGKITFVGDKDKLTLSPGDKVIDVTGKQLYPGLIALNTYLGLVEYEAVRATRDYDEVGEYNPNLHSLFAYNTDSKIIPTIRSNGVLLAQTVPIGGVISGSSSVVQLDAWNWEDAAYKTDDGVQLNWPSYLYSQSDEAEAANKYDKAVESIRRYFTQAKAYALLNEVPDVNLRFEAMRGLFNGHCKLFIHCSYVKEIMSAVAFARELGMQAVIVGGYDAWKCADMLKQNNIPVVLQRTQSLPRTKDDEVYLPYMLASKLQQAGILYCITDDGYWQQRNLPFQAGQAAGFGLTPEQALQAITLNAAKILGIEQQTGSLETGKDANIIVSDGDILDMSSNHLTHAFIQGRSIQLYNSQEALYDIYRKKYGLK